MKKLAFFFAFVLLFSSALVSSQNSKTDNCCNFKCSFNNSKNLINNSTQNDNVSIYYNRAAIVKDYELGYDLSTKNVKHIPIVFHILNVQGDSTHEAQFQNIETDILKLLSSMNKDFAGLHHIGDSVPPFFINDLYDDAIAHSLDSKIRFVLPNKDPNGNCTNGIVRYNFSQEQYDSLFHSYTYLNSPSGYSINEEYRYYTNWSPFNPPGTIPGEPSPFKLVEALGFNGNLLNLYLWNKKSYINVFIGADPHSGVASAVPAWQERAILVSRINVVNGSNSNNVNPLTHEMGHLLDLVHTHGLWQIGGNAPANTPAYVSSGNIDYSSLDVCISGINQNDSIIEFGPDNPLLTGSGSKDLPTNRMLSSSIFYQDGCYDAEPPLLYDNNAAVFGLDSAEIEYYVNLTLDEVNTAPTCSSPFTIQRKFFSPELNFMSYHCGMEFSPHQILRMHCILEQFERDDVSWDIRDVDNANLWSQSNLENVGILKGPDDNTPLEITTAVSYNCPITLIGEVIVKSSGSLALNDDLIFLDNACLTIEPGGQLIINTTNTQTVSAPYDIWLDKNCSNATSFQLQIRVILEGFYVSATNEMRTNLYSDGLLPLAQPFNTSPWNYTGSEGVIVHSSNTSDWVLIRLHDSNGVVVEEKAALVNKHGNVTTTTGNPILNFSSAIAGQDYSVSVHHKSHLAAIALASSGSFIDFTRPNVANGNEQTKDLGTTEALYAGDYDGNGIINNLDYNLWALNSAALNQYLTYDGDGNAIVNNLDYNLWGLNKSKVGELDIHY